jgi:hypothetical protein
MTDVLKWNKFSLFVQISKILLFISWEYPLSLMLLICLEKLLCLQIWISVIRIGRVLRWTAKTKKWKLFWNLVVFNFFISNFTEIDRSRQKLSISVRIFKFWPIIKSQLMFLIFAKIWGKGRWVYTPKLWHARTSIYLYYLILIFRFSESSLPSTSNEA